LIPQEKQSIGEFSVDWSKKIFLQSNVSEDKNLALLKRTPVQGVLLQMG